MTIEASLPHADGDLVCPCRAKDMGCPRGKKVVLRQKGPFTSILGQYSSTYRNLPPALGPATAQVACSVPVLRYDVLRRYGRNPLLRLGSAEWRRVAVPVEGRYVFRARQAPPREQRDLEPQVVQLDLQG